MASNIQENFTNNLNRKTRGVKQQPLWVLDAAYMPGVLIELGFLSNEEEGEFLNSDEGQSKMAHQIAEAIIKYKREYFSESYAYEEVKPIEKNNKIETKENKAEVKTTLTEVKDSIEPKVVKEDTVINAVANDEGVYKIQLFASSKKKELDSPDFKGLKNISYTFEHNLYKYFYSRSIDLEGAKKMCQEAKTHGFSDAFIVIFSGGKSTAIK